MDTSEHTMTALFEQLGLPGDAASIEAFIKQHSPLPPEVSLEDAPFWNATQAHFIAQGIDDDSDWAEVIDHLDAQLRH